MTDPKDELGARFDERRPDAEKDEDTESTRDSNNMNNTGNSGNTGGTSNMSSSSDASGSSDTSNKPGPDRDDTATRHRRQVPMYLPDEKANEFNKLYERLDGRSKVAGEGPIEKHADFMEVLVDFAVEHEDELAARLDISQE